MRLLNIISKNSKNPREGVHVYSIATIGACTLINQDVPENVGIPCRIIKEMVSTDE